MIFNDRRASTPLLVDVVNLNDDNTTANSVTIAAAFPDITTTTSLLFFPTSYYPLRSFNQMIVKWYILTASGGMTKAQLIPFTFETLFHKSTGTYTGVGWPLSSAAQQFGMAEFSFDNLQTANQSTPNTYAITKTAADATVTLGGNAFLRGSRVAIPICDDYIGFRLTHDGTASQGSYTIFVELGWA